MKRIFCCENKIRIEKIREHPTINGIEYLEVIDNDAPTNDLRQRTLLIHCVKPLVATPSLDQIHFTGGVRMPVIEVEWTALALNADALAADAVISPPERDFLMGFDHRDRIVVVRVRAAGDYDLYTVRFGINEAPLPDFDLICSQIEFSFKVECPSPFDCLPVCDSNDLRKPGPFIDYRARDYDSFRQLMLDRLRITLPEWTDRSPADLGITVLETLAYEADRLTWYQDAVSADAYLGTARTRTAVRRHARILDYTMHDGCNARALVAFTVDAGVSNLLVDKTLPTGERVQLYTKMPGTAAVISPQSAVRLKQEHSPVVFEPMGSIRCFYSHNEICFYTWGDEICCLKKRETRAVLEDDLVNRLMLRAGDILVFEQVISPGNGQAADADPLKRHAVRLTKVIPEADVDASGVRTAPAPAMDSLYTIPVVHIEWAKEDALPFHLKISERIEIDGISSVVPNLAVARGNILLVDNGETIETKLSHTPSSRPDYRPWLNVSDLTHKGPFNPESSNPGSWTVSSILHQDPPKALAEIFCTDADSIQWEVKKTLFDSDPYDYHFVAETEVDGGTRLRFGDGNQGLKPQEKPVFTVVCRAGNGQAGNIGRDALTHCVYTAGAGISSVRNPMAATGGINPETREEVRKYAPQAFRVQQRAVTEDDYARIAQRHPDVQKALAKRRWTGSWYTIFISIDRFGGEEITDEFEQEMIGFLDPFRMAGRDIEIVPPKFVSLDIALNICISDGFRISDVHRELSDRFTSGIRLDGSKGYFHPDHFTFGSSVYLSPIVNLASGVEGVRRVTVSTAADPQGVFMRWGEEQGTEIDDGVIAIGASEIARCMNDPNKPEYGRIVFQIEGGS